MANELRYYSDIAKQTAVRITDSLAGWKSFLTAAGKLYKWPYEDQLLIYAQRPDVSACADCAIWNRMGRAVLR